jgi:hypothetical protein
VDVPETLKALREDAELTSGAINAIEGLVFEKGRVEADLVLAGETATKTEEAIERVRESLGAPPGTSLVAAASRLKQITNDADRKAGARMEQINAMSSQLLSTANQLKIPVTSTAGIGLVRDLATGCERYVDLAQAARGGNASAVASAIARIDADAPDAPAVAPPAPLDDPADPVLPPEDPE